MAYVAQCFQCFIILSCVMWCFFLNLQFLEQCFSNVATMAACGHQGIFLGRDWRARGKAEAPPFSAQLLLLIELPRCLLVLPAEDQCPTPQPPEAFGQ